MSDKQPRTRVAVVVTDGDKLLLVQHRKRERTYWLLPGGGLDYGEAIADCAARELREETGLDVAFERFLYLSESIAPDASRHILHLTVLAKRVGGELGPPPEGDVIAEIAWVPFADLPGLTLFPAIAEHLMASHAAGFAHDMRYLGSRWDP